MAIFCYDHVSTDAAEHLVSIRARIRRSLDVPRPDMTLDQVDAHLAAHFARAAQADDPAPSA
jgi:antitoxin ParD1/3/4